MGQQYRSWAEGKPAAETSTLLYVPRLLVERTWHGPVVGALALFGLVFLLVRLVRRRRSQPDMIELTLFLSFPVVFTLICAAVSSHPKVNIFLPLLPFSSIAAAWFLLTLWDHLAGTQSAGRRQVILWMAMPVLLALLILPLYVPTLIYGISAISGALLATNAFWPSFLILSALSLGSLVLGPIAAAAALRIQMQ